VLNGIPLLVPGNRSDLLDKIGVDGLIEAMDLKDLTNWEARCRASVVDWPCEEMSGGKKNQYIRWPK